jgi:peptide/nickel transport system ATP-binding protein/oligopeptide transport system ATP-binding protein
MTTNHPILRVRDLRTYFHTDAGIAKAVDGVSFDVPTGKTVALVGESGCGKSVTAMSVLQLIPSPPGRIEGGEILFEGRDLLRISEREMRRVRGNDISMVFQEPMTSMNPVFRVGGQIVSVLRQHQGLSESAARARALELFRQVGIPAPEQRIDAFPHELSGGMLQRVMIAMALACGPKLLIADEPTTALDVTIQAQILDLLKDLQRDLGMSILLITHDLGVVAEVADEVIVMYAGQVAEYSNEVTRLVADPEHPYTRGLFKSLPGLQARGQRLHTIKGTVPPATAFPTGCRFHPRCPYAMEHCTAHVPPAFDVKNGHLATCWLHDEAVTQDAGRPRGIPEGSLLS